jgi:starch synthase (maltosyl-transferring)
MKHATVLQPFFLKKAKRHRLSDMKDIRQRVIIDKLRPEVDGGRFPARRAIGEMIRIEADIIADGHDTLAAFLLFRKAGKDTWETLPMELEFNDLWCAAFKAEELGIYEFTVQAWIDRFKTWDSKTMIKYADGQDVSVDLLEGADIILKSAALAAPEDADRLKGKARVLQAENRSFAERIQTALDSELTYLMALNPDRTYLTRYSKILEIRVEPGKARFSSWYEMFPRSCADDDPNRHGTFDDCIKRLPYLAKMGFDVLYLPPIHPIGRTNRKGRNNTISAEADAPGSPWAIGAEEGGHTSIHPQLGTLEDFHRLVAEAKNRGIDIAIDIAFQCSPDHPYVKEHPEWFSRRPDGTIQYAENPPKKYQDIYPFEFESQYMEELREELLKVFLYWIDQGIRIFRVDNPHTKPLRFWEWVITEIKRQHADAIFLAEAFTRPKTMYRLAKGGFTQSYTYFTWRNMKWEIEKYFQELTQSEAAEFFWPNLWPNTPDILPEYLQIGGRPAFAVRLLLAATLSSNYGIYGPAFELLFNQARESFSEEYLNSEKYAIHHWNLDQPDSLKPLITRVNRIRRDNPALQQTRNLMFHPVDHDEIICYSKWTDDYSNIILVAANLDPHHTHSTWLYLPFEEMGAKTERTFQMHELVSDARYMWHAGSNYLELNPQTLPVQIFRLRRRVRSENDFDYFM